MEQPSLGVNVIFKQNEIVIFLRACHFSLPLTFCWRLQWRGRESARVRETDVSGRGEEIPQCISRAEGEAQFCILLSFPLLCALV